MRDMSSVIYEVLGTKQEISIIRIIAVVLIIINNNNYNKFSQY